MSLEYHYPERHPQQSSWAAYLGPMILILLIGGFLVWRFWPHADSIYDANATPRAVTPRGSLAESEKTTIQIFKEASPSVVHITNMAVRQDVFSMSVQEIPQGTGTGFIWDDQGHIVTNYHVIQGASVVGIGATFNEVVREGPLLVLQFIGLISLALAIFNLIPLLPLDGGHILFALVERVRGPLRREAYERASLVGIALILVVFMFALHNDIGRFANGSFGIR